MLFQPGNNANPTGRPIGSKSKAKKPIKSKLEEMLFKNLRVIEKDLKTADPEVRRDFFVKLAAVVVTDMNPTSASELFKSIENA